MRPISGHMIVIYDQSSPKSLDHSTALLHGTVSQYRVTIESKSLTNIAQFLRTSIRQTPSIKVPKVSA